MHIDYTDNLANRKLRFSVCDFGHTYAMSPKWRSEDNPRCWPLPFTLDSAPLVHSCVRGQLVCRLLGSPGSDCLPAGVRGLQMLVLLYRLLQVPVTQTHVIRSIKQDLCPLSHHPSSPVKCWKFFITPVGYFFGGEAGMETGS